MSIFKIEKNKNYTVMSNYHLRDKNLSYKNEFHRFFIFTGAKKGECNDYLKKQKYKEKR